MTHRWLRPFPIALGLMCATMFTAAQVHAHSQPYSWIDLAATPDSLVGELTAHVVDVAHELGAVAPESLASVSGLGAHAAAVREVFARRLDLRAEDVRLAGTIGAIVYLPEKNALRVQVAFARPHSSSLEVHGPLFVWEDTHETYVNLRASGRLEVQDLLDHTHTQATWLTGEKRDLGRVVLRFVREGIHHIFIGPDHILFILGLLLLGGSLRQLLRIVTAFTIAHSLTLVAATLGWLQPPARVIEPLIALSIIVVGIENLLAKRQHRDWRAPLAFGFGLVHGFGFASVLRELALPAEALGGALVSFNVGVELGQMAIVVIAAPTLATLRRWRPAWSPGILQGGSLVVIAAGAFWLVERLLAH